jgi:hypothetical protein
MDNQQPSTLEHRIRLLVRNAKFGDGTLWKHPECKNYKGVWTSTTPELLEVKRSIAPSIFTSGVRVATVGAGRGRYANARTLYRLASTVHPLFTEARLLQKEQLFQELTLEDLGLWYLDDGCCVIRRDYHTLRGHRFSISIGNCAETPERAALFGEHMHNLFGKKWGHVTANNNSRDTKRNKTWYIPRSAAEAILQEARKYNVLLHKFPQGEGSSTIPTGSREPG